MSEGCVSCGRQWRDHDGPTKLCYQLQLARERIKSLKLAAKNDRLIIEYAKRIIKEKRA